MPQARTTNLIPDPALTPQVDVATPRVETYELRGPAGLIVEVTQNLETGETTYEKTTRTTFASDPSALH